MTSIWVKVTWKKLAGDSAAVTFLYVFPDHWVGHEKQPLSSGHGNSPGPEKGMLRIARYIWVFPKFNGTRYPQMDGENNGNTYEQMDDLGKHPY